MLNTQHKELIGYKKSDHMLISKYENKNTTSVWVDVWKTQQENREVNPIIDLDTWGRANTKT